MKRHIKLMASALFRFFLELFATKVATYRGKVEVVQIGETLDAVRIRFTEKEPGSKLKVVFFPKKRLATIRAVFEGAEVEYEIYELGYLSASTLRYVGPSAKVIMAKEPARLSDEALAALEGRR